MVTSSSCSPRPRAELRFPLPRYSYRSEWVHKPIYDLKQIALDIDQKRKGSLRDWRIYNEAGRRIEDGVRLIMLDRAANRSLSDRVFLTRCLEQEGLVQRITYDSFCIYSSQLENLDERESRLRGHTGPSNLNGSLQLHRRSQVQGISLNFGHQTNRTLPISGSSNDSGSGNDSSSGNDASSGNQLIVRANAHTFLPPWQDPPGLL